MPVVNKILFKLLLILINNKKQMKCTLFTAKTKEIVMYLPPIYLYIYLWGVRSNLTPKQL